MNDEEEEALNVHQKRRSEGSSRDLERRRPFLFLDWGGLLSRSRLIRTLSQESGHPRNEVVAIYRI